MNLFPLALIKNIYEPAGMTLSGDVIYETEGTDYGACQFNLGKHRIVFRIAKITPTKIGQFVTLWKRIKKGSEITPFHFDDPIDFVVIHVLEKKHQGQFIFNKNVLLKNGIFSSPQKLGKLAFRVYPPWSIPIATQAIKTQAWQLQYFLPFLAGKTTDVNCVKKLFYQCP